MRGKSILLIILMLAASIGASAQKYALIDMEYILKHIPEYEKGSAQLDEQSKKWQSEVEAVVQEVQALYEEYQAQFASMNDEQKAQKEEYIISKEKGAGELRRQYFGPDGELAKRQQALIRPIQDAVYEAVKQIAETEGYSVVVDRASATSIIFASPRIDISNEILARLGYSN